MATKKPAENLWHGKTKTDWAAIAIFLIVAIVLGTFAFEWYSSGRGMLAQDHGDDG